MELKIINTETLRYPMTPYDVVMEVRPTRGGITLPNEVYMPEGYSFVMEVEPPECNDETHKVVEGVPELVDGNWQQVFSVVARSPQEIAERLEAAKLAKNNQINSWRLEANRGTFEHGGAAFACDELSRSDTDGITSFVSLYGVMPPGWPGAWKAKDNSFFPITSVADWKSFVASMVAQGNANFAKAQALKAQLAAATTREQLDSIVW